MEAKTDAKNKETQPKETQPPEAQATGKKPRGRPRKVDTKEATTTKGETKAKTPREAKPKFLKLDSEQRELIDLQRKLRMFKESEKAYKEALKGLHKPKGTTQPKAKAKAKATAKKENETKT